MKDKQKQLLIEVMNADAKDGLYHSVDTTKMVTAMEQLIEWIDSDCSPMDCVMKAKELLKVEKEQQFRFFIAGQLSMEEGGKDFEQYYNETYGEQKTP